MSELTTEPTASPPPQPPQKSIMQQRLVDIGLGIVLPIFALAFDPLVFGGVGCAGQGFLGRYTLFAYLTIGLGMFCLAVWIAAGQWLQKAAGVFAGVFLIGAIFSFLLGLGMLPVSLFGLLWCVGILGFLPFGTAFVYYRSCRKVFNIAYRNLNPRYQWWPSITSFMGGIAVIAIPAIIQLSINRTIDNSMTIILESDDPDQQAIAVRNLQSLDKICSNLCLGNLYYEIGFMQYRPEYHHHYPQLNNIRTELMDEPTISLCLLLTPNLGSSQ